MRIVILLLFLLVIRSCPGQLVFDNKELEFHPGAEAKSQTAEYGFHNAGKYSVTITAVKPSCGCTTVALDKYLYAPGEKGVIKAVFDFGVRTGLQEKDIAVTTSDPSNPTIRLVLRTTIPELVQISPGFILWVLGEEPLPKTIFIKVINASPIKITKVTSDNPRLQGELRTIKEGAEYLYILTPPTTAQAEKATLLIQTDYPPKQPRVFTAYAEIKQMSISGQTQTTGPGSASAMIKGLITPPPGVILSPPSSQPKH
jgi:hypothetical protein